MFGYKIVFTSSWGLTDIVRAVGDLLSLIRLNYDYTYFKYEIKLADPGAGKTISDVLDSFRDKVVIKDIFSIGRFCEAHENITAQKQPYNIVEPGHLKPAFFNPRNSPIVGTPLNYPSEYRNFPNKPVGS